MMVNDNFLFNYQVQNVQTLAQFYSSFDEVTGSSYAKPIDTILTVSIVSMLKRSF